MSIKPDTRHTMKNPGSCPGCYEDDRLLIETEHYGDEDFNEVRRFCDVCGCHWEEISPTRPTDIGISRPPQDKNIKYLLEDNDGHVDPKSPVGKYLAAKISRKAHSGTPERDSQLEAAWFGGAPAGKTAGNGLIMLQGLVDFRKLGKVRSNLKGVDDQSAELLRDVLAELADAMELTSGQQQALNRLKWVAEKGGSADPALLRNNIFKAANSLGMKLPSGMFASQKTAGKLHKQAAQKVIDGGPMNQAIGHKLERCLEAALQMAGSLTPASQSMRPKDMGHGDLWMVDGLEGTDGSDHFFEAHADISWTGRLGVWHVSVNHPQRGKSQDKGKYDGARKMKDVSKAIADAINQLGGGR